MPRNSREGGVAEPFASGEKRPSAVEFPGLEAIFHHFRGARR